MAETTHTTSESLAPGASPYRSADLAARAVDDVKGMGAELLGVARDSAVAFLDEQRSRAAKEITAVGNVLHSSVKSLDEAGGPTVARYAEDAARQIDGFAEKLRDGSWSELSAEFEDFARRSPAAFFAAALGVGVIAGRVLFAPPPRPATPRPVAPPVEPIADEPIPSELPPGTARQSGAVGGAVPSATPAGYRAPDVGEGI